MIRRRSDRGQALVEFAIVIPVFLLLLTGLLDGSRLVFAWNGASQAARNVARTGAVTCLSLGGCDNPSVAAAEAAQAIQMPEGGSWTVRCIDAQTLAPPSGRPCVAGDLVEVTASETVHVITPIVSALIPTLLITATSRVEIVQ